MKTNGLHTCSMLALLALTAAAGLPACAAQTGDPEAVGATSEALGEVGCETATKDVDTGQSYNCAVEWNASPDASYGSLHPSCPGQYLVGFGTTTSELQAVVGYAGPPITSSLACARTELTLGAYSEVGTTWTVQTTKMLGQWNASSSTCEFAYDTAEGYGPIFMPAATKNRLAGAASTLELECPGGPLCEYVAVPQKVEVTLVGLNMNGCIH